ncbi:hypothetical protein, partial [Escherichia coli]|uniref:hypothetical protein n=1 Tax=Escherichia coli TaxID=562 RepID=UPI00208DBB6F
HHCFSISLEFIAAIRWIAEQWQNYALPSGGNVFRRPIRKVTIPQRADIAHAIALERGGHLLEDFSSEAGATVDHAGIELDEIGTRANLGDCG